jgi:hypothetical protein
VAGGQEQVVGEGDKKVRQETGWSDPHPNVDDGVER